MVTNLDSLVYVVGVEPIHYKSRLTLTMIKIFIQAPKIMKQMAKDMV